MEPLTYTLESIDRAATVRGDEPRVRALLSSTEARFIPIWKQRHFLDSRSQPNLLSYAELSARVDLAQTITSFLGFVNNAPWFAAGLPESESPPALGIEGAYRNLNEVVLLLPSDQASVLAYARAMVIWHENHRHCGRCGAAAAITEAGHSRSCTNSSCGHRTFPRTDPVVITLILHGDKCLLGRQAVWPPGVYSAIAGFVEPGESLEAAVRREAEEETGIKVGDVRYMASQPWPFPASIMLGFRAYALTTEVQRNDNELEDCRWFTKAEIRSFTERDSSGPGFKLPNRFAIARYLLEQWLRE